MRVEAYAQKSIHNVWQQIDKIKYESTDVNENQCKVCCNVKTWIKQDIFRLRGRRLISNFHWHQRRIQKGTKFLPESDTFQIRSKAIKILFCKNFATLLDPRMQLNHFQSTCLYVVIIEMPLIKPYIYLTPYSFLYVQIHT